MCLSSVQKINQFIRQLFCKHDYYLIRCIYGDEAMYGRYEYRCEKCGKIKYTWHLIDNANEGK